MKSLTPPKAEKSKLGDVWINPVTKERFMFNSEDWERWDLDNERRAYEKGEDDSSSE